MPHPIGNIEQQYGCITVLKRVQVLGKTQAHYLCRCVCGKEWTVSGGSLRKGQKSCGCQPQTYGNKLRPYESIFNWLRTRGIKLDKYDGLTYEEFLEFISVGKCFYCGDDLKWAEFSYRSKNSNVNLDRIDSSKGYSKANCVPCCWNCNTMKSDLNQEVFLKQIAKIQKFQERNK